MNPTQTEDSTHTTYTIPTPCESHNTTTNGNNMDTTQLQKQLTDAQAMIKKQAERIADLEMFASAKLGLEEMPSSESVTPSTDNGTVTPFSPVSSETQDAEIDNAFASMAPPPPRSSRYSVLK